MLEFCFEEYLSPLPISIYYTWVLFCKGEQLSVDWISACDIIIEFTRYLIQKDSNIYKAFKYKTKKDVHGESDDDNELKDLIKRKEDLQCRLETAKQEREKILEMERQAKAEMLVKSEKTLKALTYLLMYYQSEEKQNLNKWLQQPD
ncbi:unnamed protein product [Orchesella dallaii]|uniref:Uncharacterized protein n=1 Tax=Orchesella dallaii TaxID=48710 RepID=A0ABP1QBX0_9HEXA